MLLKEKVDRLVPSMKPSHSNGACVLPSEPGKVVRIA